MMAHERRGKDLLLVLVVMLATSGLAPRSMASGYSDSDKSAFLVSVFDCYMPVPNNFVLNTQDTSGITLFLGAALDAMRIKISNYREELDSSLTLVRERKMGGLAVEELQNALRKDIRVTRIHDLKQQVMVYGGTDELVESLVQGCLTKKHGELFAE